MTGLGDNNYELSFDKSMMLISDPDGGKKCRLPFVELNDENSEKKHVVLGSFVLQKYNINVNVDDETIGIGIKNVSYSRPDIHPVNPDDPTDPTDPDSK